MSDIYAVFFRGGDGHYFLIGALAQSFLNSRINPPFNEGIGHDYGGDYFARFCQINPNSNPSDPFYVRYMTKDSSTPYISMASFGDVEKIKKLYKTCTFIGITITPEDYLTIEANHFLKHFRYCDILTHRAETIPRYYSKYQSENPSLPPIDSFTLLDDIPKDIAGKGLKELVAKGSYGFTDDYLEGYTENCYRIPFKTLMNDAEGTLSFIESITGNPRTPALIENVMNYQQAQRDLRKKYPDFFNNP
jgi:hypothetical protein